MKKIVAFIILGMPLLLAVSCRLYKMERRLKPDDADFLSKVRYIITHEERKIFLELPDPEKNAFKEEFWKRRDPDPTTEENEFKTEYFNRQDRADELFRGEGKPGWLTDRGRIFILFGPPLDRSTYPMDSGGFCREVWYYGEFPVVFIDEHCSGTYILTAIDLRNLQDLNIAQDRIQRSVREGGKLFDFEVKIKKETFDQNGYKGSLIIELPYSSLWFGFKEGKLGITLDVEAELKTASGELFWKGGQVFKILLEEKELPALRGKKYVMEIPLVLEGNLEALKTGKSKLQVSLKTSTDENLKKVVDFRLD